MGDKITPALASSVFVYQNGIYYPIKSSPASRPSASRGRAGPSFRGRGAHRVEERSSSKLFKTHTHTHSRPSPRPSPVGPHIHMDRTDTATADGARSGGGRRACRRAGADLADHAATE